MLEAGEGAVLDTGRRAGEDAAATMQSGMMPKSTDVELGARFVKTNVPNMVWTVEKLFQLPSEPRHARLYRESQPRDKITVSVPTLFNPRFFRRASTGPHAN